MTTQQITTSAVLYFCSQQKYDFLAWFNKIRQLFYELDVPLTFFDVRCEGFRPFEFHEMAKRGEELIQGLQNGLVKSLYLHSPRSYPGPLSDWKATAFLKPQSGICYIGIDAELINILELLRKTYEMGKNIIDIRYGIAYKMPLLNKPDCYASGGKSFSLSELNDFFTSERNETRNKSPDELWEEELDNMNRHLFGLFRTAYPANILSEAHIHVTDLKSREIGRLTELDPTHWLWELSDSELIEAELLLEKLGVLIRCAKPAT
jgi:hypothetical protein